MSPEWYHRDWLLLGMLDASNLLQYAIHNFYSYHCLFGLASRGLQRPRWAQISVFGMSQRVILSWLITSGHVGRFQPVPICHTQLLFLPLSVWFDLYRPLEVSRGPNEPKCVFSGRSQSDIIVMYHSWARVGPPTTSGEVSRPLWTKSDLLTLPRRWFRPEIIILSPFLTLEKKCICFCIDVHSIFASQYRPETFTPPR